MEMFTFKTIYIYTEIATTQQSTSKEFEILEKNSENRHYFIISLIF